MYQPVALSLRLILRRLQLLLLLLFCVARTRYVPLRLMFLPTELANQELA
jgi:hypothetical protein